MDQTPAMVSYDDELDAYEIIVPGFAIQSLIERLEATKVDPEMFRSPKLGTNQGPTLFPSD